MQIYNKILEIIDEEKYEIFSHAIFDLYFILNNNAEVNIVQHADGGAEVMYDNMVIGELDEFQFNRLHEIYNEQQETIKRKALLAFLNT